jgi:hypothetical protein
MMCIVEYTKKMWKYNWFQEKSIKDVILFLYLQSTFSPLFYVQMWWNQMFYNT